MIKKSVFLLLMAMVVFLSGCAAQNADSSENGAKTDSKFDSITKKADAFTPYLTSGLDYLILVNKSHTYEPGSEYDKLLQDNMVVFADNVDGDYIKLEKGAYTAFTGLRQFMDQKYGMEIGIYDAYRSPEAQVEAFTTYCRAFWGDLKDDPDYDGYREWQKQTPLAEPGHSEAHTGLLLNVVIKHQEKGTDKQPIWYTESVERQQKIKRFKVLHEHLADFGFIDRYPAGKEEWTGVPCEPFQIRFVGSSEIAHQIMDNNLSLEEYLGETTKYDVDEPPSEKTLKKYLSD